MNIILWVWIFFLILKLILSAWLPLSTDEAYYWLWSHHPQLSYYDHPPFIAWLYSFGHLFEGFSRALRWPGVLLGHLTVLVWIQILRPYIIQSSLVWWLVLMCVAPLTGLGSIIITPDIPLLFFCSLAILCFQRWLDSNSVSWAIWWGLSLGLGISSKYLIVLMIPSFFLWAYHAKETRRFLKLCLYALIPAVVGALPVLIWNIQNDFLSFKFQLDHGLGGKVWKPSWTWTYLVSQILILFPPLIFFGVRERTPRMFWLHFFIWPILLFFAITSFRGHVEVNWPIMVHAPLFALVAYSYQGWLRRAALFWITISLLLFSQLKFSWLPVDSSQLKTKELTKYENLLPLIKNVDPLYARTYQMASKLSYESGRFIFKLHGLNRVDFFDFRKESRPEISPYFVIVERGENLPAWTTTAGHQIIERTPLDDIYELVKVAIP